MRNVGGPALFPVDHRADVSRRLAAGRNRETDAPPLAIITRLAVYVFVCLAAWAVVLAPFFVIF